MPFGQVPAVRTPMAIRQLLPLRAPHSHVQRLQANLRRMRQRTLDPPPHVPRNGLQTRRKVYAHTDALRKLRKQPAHIHRRTMPNKIKGETARTRNGRSHGIRHLSGPRSSAPPRALAQPALAQPAPHSLMGHNPAERPMLLSLNCARGEAATFAVINFVSRSPQYLILLLQEPWLNVNKEPLPMTGFDLFLQPKTYRNAPHTSGNPPSCGPL